MKIIFVFTLFILSVYAGQEGESCDGNTDCDRDNFGLGLECKDKVCKCEYGKRWLAVSTPDTNAEYKCVDVVGSVCVNDHSCSIDLPSSKCVSGKCVCNEDDGCKTSGAFHSVQLSVLLVVAAVIGILRF